ncbi:SagB/ThcOx family dehydrogenase [Actinoplanes sp. NEAU-A12]|uniref:SagB/ThcOx family dehydrogenase n=1 Tax=Actinoplanes sandaracinus TaxID=3045177 RepID=A0ABT6WZ11_9ACTN|nr:SagB/ThcOx family dehydrogenase [Actinoplanes sandaracinus]MDI6104840.1 SagB/ThcOx family dehydrogenase [Actinoplanes sandaracinus]
MEIRLNPAVRIHPPSPVTGERWLAEDILARTRFTVSPAAAAALVASVRPQGADELAGTLAAAAGDERPLADWQRLIAGLLGRGLLRDAADTDEELDWLVDVRRRWSRYGWHESVEYHTLAFDYPCVDYATGAGFLADRDRMRQYRADEPETERFKLDYADHPAVDLPDIDDDLIPATARDYWAGEIKPVPIDLDGVRRVIAAAFGITGWIVRRSGAPPALRRSSPSGGGRHPSEGYLIAHDVPGLEPGWYHVTMQPFGLRRVGDLPVDDQSLSRLFPNAAGRFPVRARALLVVTSVFERNMFRYREPRTYRTVHMDAGHIAKSFLTAAGAAGLSSAIFYCDAGTEIERLLGLDGLTEGYMLTVALGDGHEEDLRQLVGRVTA